MLRKQSIKKVTLTDHISKHQERNTFIDDHPISAECLNSISLTTGGGTEFMKSDQSTSGCEEHRSVFINPKFTRQNIFKSQKETCLSTANSETKAHNFFNEHITNFHDSMKMSIIQCTECEEAWPMSNNSYRQRDKKLLFACGVSEKRVNLKIF